MKRTHDEIANDDAPSFELTAEQRAVLDDVFTRRRNVFITGGAGVGKSITARAIIERCEATNTPFLVASSTNQSAFNLHPTSQTLHKTFGMGAATASTTRPRKHFLQLVRRKRHELLNAIMRARLLIIDEISMITDEILEFCEELACEIRCENRADAWGGLQLVVLGDFYQLPPVAPGAEEPRFAFEALRAWRAANIRVHQLTVVHRQHGDAAFAELLNDMRVGFMPVKHRVLLESRTRPTAEGVTGVILTPSNRRAQEHNERLMAKLDPATERPLLGTLVVTRKVLPEDRPARELEECRADALDTVEKMRVALDMKVRVGCVVVCMATDKERGYTKGMTGVVAGYTRTGGVIVDWDVIGFMEMVQHEFQFETEDYTASYVQFPLLAAFAMTVHRAQGLTLKRGAVDLTGSSKFIENTPGLAYVAFSRFVSLDSFTLIGALPRRFATAAKVEAFYEG